MIEWVFGIATVISLVIAIWQYYESRYYQKINEYNNKRINQLMTENQSLLHKIDKGTEQTFKHKDMNKLLPKIFDMKSSFGTDNIDEKISSGFAEIREEIAKMKKGFKSDSRVQREIESLDSKIQKTERKTLQRTDEDHINLALTTINDLDELKNSISVLSWIEKEPRRFKMNIFERHNLFQETDIIKTYEFPDLADTIHLPVFTLDIYKPFFDIRGERLILSKLGKKLLERMNNLLRELSK